MALKENHPILDGDIKLGLDRKDTTSLPCIAIGAAAPGSAIALCKAVLLAPMSSNVSVTTVALPCLTIEIVLPFKRNRSSASRGLVIGRNGA